VHASKGDWLLIEGHAGGSRRGLITETHGPGGAPPYEVRWLDTDRVALVFPGSDARVVTAAEMADLDSVATERAQAVQSRIASDRARKEPT
jgi:hypothetical protein